MQIYLDYNATAPLMPAARAAVVAGLDLLNASSVHGFGRAARSAVSHSRGILAGFLGVKPAQIIFTSGATEALVTALRGVRAASYMISAVEHEAVRATTQTLLLPGGRRWPAGPDEGAATESKSFQIQKSLTSPSPAHDVGTLSLQGEGNFVGIIPVDANGIIDLEKLESLLQNSAAPALVAVQFVNNETGVIQPIEKIIQLAKQYQALVLVDAVQAVGRIDLSPMFQADMMVVAAHKMGGPRGAAALVLREGLSITPLITGGGQEERRRAGTENVAAIVGFGATIEHISESLDKQKDLGAWRDAMETEIKTTLPNVKFYGQNSPRISNTSMFALPGVTASTQLMNLDLAGIAVSSGAACASGKVAPSHVLMAMGEGEDIAGSAIRVSAGWATTAEDFQAFTKNYIEMAKRLMVAKG